MDRHEREALDRHLTTEPEWLPSFEGAVWDVSFEDDDASEFTKILRVSRHDRGHEDRFRVFWRTCGVHPHGVWKTASHRDGALACPGDWSNVVTEDVRADVLRVAELFLQETAA